MKTAVINLKVDPVLKARAQKRARELGVPLSYVLHTQLLNFVGGGKIELPSTTITPHLEKLLKEVGEEIVKGEVSPAFDKDDIDGMKQWLLAKDDD